MTPFNVEDVRVVAMLLFWAAAMGMIHSRLGWLTLMVVAALVTGRTYS